MYDSNFYPDRLVDLIEHNEVAPMVDQVECHPFFQRAAEQQLMSDRGVRIESWGPFAEGRNNLFTDFTLTAIGSAHGKSVAQVVLRWLIQRGVVVVQKSVRAERMRENMDIFDFQLSDADMSGIAAMDRGESLFFDHRDPGMASQFANRRLNRTLRQTPLWRHTRTLAHITLAPLHRAHARVRLSRRLNTEAP